MRVFDPLTLLALPNDVAVQFDGFAARCAVHAREKLATHAGTLFSANFEERGAEVMDDVTRHSPDVAPMTCWDCNIQLRGLNDLNPV